MSFNRIQLCISVTPTQAYSYLFSECSWTDIKITNIYLWELEILYYFWSHKLNIIMKLTLRICEKCYFLNKWRRNSTNFVSSAYLVFMLTFVPQCHEINYFYCSFLDGRLYLKTTVMYWIFPVEEIHVIVKNFADIRHWKVRKKIKSF